MLSVAIDRSRGVLAATAVAAVVAHGACDFTPPELISAEWVYDTPWVHDSVRLQFSEPVRALHYGFEDASGTRLATDSTGSGDKPDYRDVHLSEEVVADGSLRLIVDGFEDESGNAVGASEYAWELAPWSADTMDWSDGVVPAAPEAVAWRARSSWFVSTAAVVTSVSDVPCPDPPCSELTAWYRASSGWVRGTVARGPGWSLRPMAAGLPGVIVMASVYDTIDAGILFGYEPGSWEPVSTPFLDVQGISMADDLLAIVGRQFYSRRMNVATLQRGQRATDWAVAPELMLRTPNGRLQIAVRDRDEVVLLAADVQETGAVALRLWILRAGAWAEWPARVVPSIDGDISVAVGDGVTYVAWTEVVDDAPMARVAQVDAEGWTVLPSSIAAGVASRAVQVVVDDDGGMYCSWTELTGTGAAGHVDRWTGTSWRSLGIVWTSADTTAASDLTLWAGHTPLVSWRDGSRIGFAGYNYTRSARD